MEPLPAAVFVYGTLMPGRLRWPLLAPDAVGWAPEAVPGALFDTGDGWPAAVFDPRSTARVPGVRVTVRPDRLSELLAELDVVEDTADGLFRRELVTTDAGEPAWAWSFAQPTAGLVPIERWSDQPER